MKKTTLVLIAITLFFTNLYGESYNFKDGSVVHGHIFKEKGFEPDEYGVILATGEKIYIHHYPVMDEALSPPLYYLGGINPYGMPSCTPSRISFYHFSTFTLAGIKDEVKKMNIPISKKTKTLKAISKAMRGEVPDVMKNPTLGKARKWRWKYTLYLSGYAKQGKLIWGENYAFDLSFKKNNTFNSGSSFSEKRSQVRRNRKTPPVIP